MGRAYVESMNSDRRFESLLLQKSAFNRPTSSSKGRPILFPPETTMSGQFREPDVCLRKVSLVGLPDEPLISDGGDPAMMSHPMTSVDAARSVA